MQQWFMVDAADTGDASAVEPDGTAPLPSDADPAQADTPGVVPAPPSAEAVDPWGAILEAGAALLQGLAAARSDGAHANGAAPFAIERDPVTGQASVRLPLPEPAVLRRLAQAFEPWLK